jgi:ferredoxin-NADP reductase
MEASMSSRRPRLPGLPAAVRRLLASRLVAALATPHGVDRYLEQLDPLWSVGEVRAEVVDRRRETAAATTLTLRPNRTWRGFQAGQHVRLTVEIDGVRRTRCYSLSSSELRDDGLVEITVKRHTGGQVSPALVDHVAEGTVVTISQAEGQLTLPDPLPAQVILVSGGSGITPCMSILRTLLDDDYRGRITFLHWAHRREEVIFRNELEERAHKHANLDLRLFYTRGPAPAPHFHAGLLAGLGDLASAEVYACGPTGLCDAVAATWVDLGLAARLHVERFTPPPPPPAHPEAGGTIHLARSGGALAGDGRTLLVQAEAAGLSPDSGCRMGICMSCKCKKTSGPVMDLRTGAVSNEPDQDIQLCVSVPMGDVTLDL